MGITSITINFCKFKRKSKYLLMAENLFGYDTGHYLDRIKSHYNSKGTKIIKYSTTAYHKGLNVSKMVTAPNMEVLYEKLDNLERKWTDEWNILVAKEKAEQRSKDAALLLKEIKEILYHPFKFPEPKSLEDYKKHDKFLVPPPKQPQLEDVENIPEKPNLSTKYNFLDNHFLLLKKWKKEKYERQYKFALAKWENRKRAIEEDNEKIQIKNNKKIKSWEEKYLQWEKEYNLFYYYQDKHNSRIDNIILDFQQGTTNGIQYLFEFVLWESNYPNIFSKDIELQYNRANEILVVNYRLPDIEKFPRLKEVQFIQSSRKFKEIYLSDTQFQKLYDYTLYNITLRTISELFEADKSETVKMITFNGWVDSMNRATGKKENRCILTVQVNRYKFLEINLEHVDPKACFKGLKGISSTQLFTLTPIKPLMQINREDKRFVQSYEVTNKLDSSTNIAIMDWKDFEHFVRETFEKEFRSNGGEVKVTQASKDGGVDAIAFDPDPIRGGKIVIQAKRYTNTVDVSAVRDLYGTVLNEGATKGILVTTSSYGPDAYNFAKDKPLTLIDGSGLLYMLEKHGQRFRIDLVEAKKFLKDE
mgnify:CR=1 FL=1